MQKKTSWDFKFRNFCQIANFENYKQFKYFFYQTVEDCLQTPGKTEIRYHAFAPNTWKEAVNQYAENGPISCGTKSLLRKLFTQIELETRTPGRRQKAKNLDKEKNKPAKLDVTLDNGRQTQLLG